MNLFAFINRGAAHAPSDAQRQQAAVDAALEASRAQWLNALLVDETRAWLEAGTASRDVLNGMATMLTIAGFVHVFDARRVDSADLRVLRGAISAATAAAQSGDVITAADARAFSSAAARAKAIITAGSLPAIQHAALSIRQTVGLPT